MADYPGLSGLSTYDSKGKKVNPKGIVIHHSAGWPFRRSGADIIRTLNKRGLSANLVMDRQGEISYGVPPGAYADHMRDGGYKINNPPDSIIGLSNDNMKRDFKAARRIVNGTDKAATIAGYAQTFLAALTA
jgi:hypothetical protein